MITTTLKRFGTLALAVIAVSALLVAPVGAQEPTTRTVNVTGVGEAFGIPDTVSIYLGVDTLDANVSAAVAQANQKLELIVNAVKELGVEATDIQTANFSVYPEEQYNPQTGVSTGERFYRVQQSVTIIVRDITRAGEVIDAGLNAGANAINGVSFGISDTKALESQARLEAVKDANARATELATAFGLGLGNVITISEYTGATPYPVDALYTARAVGGDSSTQLNIGQITVSIEINVTFILE